MSGAVLWVALLMWALRGAQSPDAAAPLRDLLLLVAAVYVLARLVSRLQRWATAAAAAIIVSLIAVWHLGGALSGLTVDPVGYANASAALYVTGCASALVVVARARRREIRSAATCGAVLCALLPWINTAFAAGLLVLPLPFALVSRQVGVRVRAVIVLSATAALLALVVTAAVGAVWPSGTALDMIVAPLSSNRAQLWSEALDLMTSSPVQGVGTNRFAAESPTARRDLDLRWAHNEYLQMGAERGVPGLALMVGLLAWVFVRLAVGARDHGTAVVAVGVAGASIAASVDYVWHFPAVLVAVAVLAGGGGGVRRPRLGVVGRVDRWEPRVGSVGTGDALWPQQLGQRDADDPKVEQR